MRPGTKSPIAINDAGQGPTHPSDRAINILGQTVGSRYVPGSTARQATLSMAGETIAIHPPGNFTSEAIALNDRGQVLVKAEDNIGEFQSYLYDDGKLTQLRFKGSGPNLTAAVDMNNLGQIVGHHVGENWNAEAFIYENAEFSLLGTLPGGGWTTATAINDLGQVVGNSYFESELGTRAFLYEGGGLLDLNDLIPLETGWTLLDANDINDQGQILVKGSRGGRNRALILTPSPVPEPTALATFGSIVMVICWRRRKQWSKAFNFCR